MPKALGRYIETNPEILGGTPVISGTRMPVERVFQLVKQGMSVEDLQESYPWVDKKKIQYTIAYLMQFLFYYSFLLIAYIFYFLN